MKLLYGVQGTGNGHISRARMMAQHFADKNVDVQFLFSGRDPEHYFDMDIFLLFCHKAQLDNHLNVLCLTCLFFVFS